MCFMSHPSHSPWYDRPQNIWWRVQIMELLSMHFFPPSCHFIPLRSKYSPKHPVLKHPQKERLSSSNIYINGQTKKTILKSPN
jgi:hypothetical protein